jgi:hypothetical protein
MTRAKHDDSEISPVHDDVTARPSPRIAAELIVSAFREGRLGPDVVPEDDEPAYINEGDRWAFLALVTSVNYRRNSASLWRSAKAAYEDSATRWIFDVAQVTTADREVLLRTLTSTGVAIQPTRQVPGWRAIAESVHEQWGSFQTLVNDHASFHELRRTVQVDYRKGFPYLSGPKLFNYWNYTMMRKGMTSFPDANLIDVAVDSHVMKSSVQLGLPAAISGAPAPAVASEWRDILAESWLVPTDLTVPLWIWSRANFEPSVDALSAIDRRNGKP